MMPRFLRKPVRLVLLCAAGAALLALLAPVSSSDGPYVSALSDLAAAPAFAKGCPDKRCNRNVQCVAGIGNSCRKVGTSGCEASPCV